MSEIRLEWRTPAELKDNPENWRVHPEGQESAVRKMISDVGWAGAALYNETTGRLIDGHLRKKIARKDEKIPVLIGSWTEEQERKILATLDPIAEMAQVNEEALKELMEQIQGQDSELDDILQSIAENSGVALDEIEDNEEQELLEQNSQLLAQGQPKDLSPDGVFAPDPGLQASHVRMVQLFFDTETFPEFIMLWRTLADEYNTANATETVLECLRRAKNQLKG